MLLKSDNKFRMYSANIVGHSNFDNVVLFLILFSTVLLAIEDPFDKLNSQVLLYFKYARCGTLSD